MARVGNPRKQFQFNISIPGMNPFLAQKVKIADVELDMVEHGDVNFKVKTAGMKTVGTLTVDKISPAEVPDYSMWDWIQSIQDTRSGGGLLPDDYKTSILIEQYSVDGVTVIHRWEALGSWPQKINGIEFDRMGSQNTVESVEFCIDEFNAI